MWGKPEHVETAIVFHRLGLFVAEVTQSVGRKADVRIAAARNVAEDLRRLGVDLSDLINLLGPAEDMWGPEAAAQLRQLRKLERSTQRFTRVFASFMAEHGMLVDESTRASVQKFLAWLPERISFSCEQVKRFEKKIAEDIASDRSRMNELAHDWSSVDSDGLS